MLTQRLRAKIKRLGIREVARQLGKDPSLVSRWASGARSPNAQSQRRLENLFAPADLQQLDREYRRAARAYEALADDAPGKRRAAEQATRLVTELHARTREAT
jgi:transcriptional regulator with XRE-family HTH domain